MPLKIAILSKADLTGGGASRMAEQLCGQLNAAGYIAHHYLAFKRSEYISARKLYGNPASEWRIIRLHRWVKRCGFPELIPWELFPLWRQGVLQYDLLHFHDLSSSISPLTVRYLARRVPTVWTFHDCSPFTGGCLFPEDCTKFHTHCSRCPQLGEWPLDTKRDFATLLQRIKRKTAQEGRFTPIVPSSWMVSQAMKSKFFAKPPSIVPNGIDMEVFKPFDKVAMRAKLGLPLDRFIVLLSAANLSSPRKGVRFAVEALKGVAERKPYVLLLGNGVKGIQGILFGLDYCDCSFVADDQKRAEYFAAADVLLCPSLAESFCLVVLEAMAVATPAISFATGGITDLILHEQTGYLVEPRNVEGLVTGLQLALTDGCATEWGRNARKRAVDMFSKELFLAHHLRVYEQVISEFKGP